MNLKTLFCGLILLSFISCKKSSSTAAEPDKYMTTTATSSWNYQQTNNAGAAPVVTNYTITSTSRDTTINSKSYHIYSNSAGANQFYNITSHDYYQFDSLPGGLSGGNIERLYLKDDQAVGFSWTQNLSVNIPGIPIPIPVTLTNSITEKGISRTVNGVVYNDVIHVSTSISSALIPAANLTSSINNYYARKYGQIESSTIVNLNFSGFVQNVNVQTKLMSATLH